MKKLILITLFSACGVELPDDKPRDCTTSFAWDVPSEEDLARTEGYRFYIGTASGDYTETVELEVQHEYAFKSAECDKEYFVAVTAFNEHGESDFSDEVRFVAGEKGGAE